jgi:hypothetical protein
MEVSMGKETGMVGIGGNETGTWVGLDMVPQEMATKGMDLQLLHGWEVFRLDIIRQTGWAPRAITGICLEDLDSGGNKLNNQSIMTDCENDIM